MRRNLSLKATTVADALDDAGDEGGTVEHAHLAGYADVSVDHGVVVGDHVLVGSLGRDGVFEGIGGAAEEETPEGAMDEVQEGQDAEGSVWGGGGGRGGAGEGGGGRTRDGAVEEEVEKTKSEGIALFV